MLQSNGHFAPCIQFALLILEFLLAVSTWIFCFQLEGLQLFDSLMELCHKVWMNEHCIRIVTIQSPAISSIYHSWHLKQSMRGDLDTTSVSSGTIFPCFVRMSLHACLLGARVGEASKPGPSLSVAVINPAALYGKTSEVVSLPANLVMCSETSVTLASQKVLDHEFNNLGWKTFWSKLQIKQLEPHYSESLAK